MKMKIKKQSTTLARSQDRRRRKTRDDALEDKATRWSGKPLRIIVTAHPAP